MRGLLAALLSVLLANPAAAASKVLIVKSKALQPFDQAAREFKRCLASSGASVSFEEVILPDESAQAEASLIALAASKPDLVLGIGIQAAALSRNKARSVPSIFCMVIDPLASGLDKGGISMDPRPAEYVDYIRRHFPDFKRIGVLHNPSKSKSAVTALKAINAAPHTLVFEEVTDMAQIDRALQNLKSKADCLLMVMDTTIYNSQTSSQIIFQTIQMNLPLMALSSAFVRAGALAAVYADPADNGCQAADLAAKVLQGENPVSLPLSLPRKTNSAVNLVVATRLGVKVSAGARASAEEVIK